ncbi:MAG: hypothetical protein MJ237_08095 [bacterium]|nr:hypothetical protein [bacterium]
MSNKIPESYFNVEFIRLMEKAACDKDKNGTLDENNKNGVNELSIFNDAMKEYDTDGNGVFNDDDIEALKQSHTITKEEEMAEAELNEIFMNPDDPRFNDVDYLKNLLEKVTPFKKEANIFNFKAKVNKAFLYFSDMANSKTIPDIVKINILQEKISFDAIYNKKDDAQSE